MHAAAATAGAVDAKAGDNGAPISDRASAGLESFKRASWTLAGRMRATSSAAISKANEKLFLG